MKIQKLICRLDGTQELELLAVPADWESIPAPAEVAENAQNPTADADK